MSDPLRDYDTASEWLGVPRRWLEDQVRTGNAPHTRLGKHVRFTQVHLDELVAANERRPRGEVQLPPDRDAMRPSPRGRRK